MVSFQRMRDSVDNLESQVSNKFPLLRESGCTFIVIGVVSLIVIFVIGIGIGYAAHKGPSGDSSSTSTASELMAASPRYIYVSNNSQSCPALGGERLLTTVQKGQSFEGLVVRLACQGDYNAFPMRIKCQRKNAFNDDSALEWSHLPVCYPSLLISQTYWAQTLHARSVSCTGDSSSTQCKMSCIRDYVAVESKPYTCTSPPCKSWSLADSKCFMCDQKCNEMHQVANPNAIALVNIMDCGCDRIIIQSNGNAAIWQSKRTGLFSFIGEHNGRPVYQNNATKEFLYYTLTGSEWLVGPEFRNPHAGIQLFGNDDKFCPEKYGGKNVSKLYIDSSGPSPDGTGKWTSDETISFTCMSDDYEPVRCDCKRYKVYNTVYAEGKEVPQAVTYLSGEFDKMSNENEIGFLAPVYRNKIKQLYLFSHHPMGKVWQISSKLSTTPIRGTSADDLSCPDSDQITWEWFNATTSEGQQLYVRDDNIQIKCILR